MENILESMWNKQSK